MTVNGANWYSHERAGLRAMWKEWWTAGQVRVRHAPGVALEPLDVDPGAVSWALWSA